MANKEHFIVLRKADRQELKEKFGVSESTLSEALNYRRNSEIARRIRVASINHHNGIYF